MAIEAIGDLRAPSALIVSQRAPHCKPPACFPLSARSRLRGACMMVRISNPAFLAPGKLPHGRKADMPPQCASLEAAGRPTEASLKALAFAR
jgi:hypothetical protein